MEKIKKGDRFIHEFDPDVVAAITKTWFDYSSGEHMVEFIKTSGTGKVSLPEKLFRNLYKRINGTTK